MIVQHMHFLHLFMFLSINSLSFSHNYFYSVINQNFKECIILDNMKFIPVVQSKNMHKAVELETRIYSVFQLFL